MHIITGLNAGGAETALLRLLTAIDNKRFSSIVVSLGSGGAIEPGIEALGVPVHCVGLSGNLLSITRIYRLLRLIREWNPDLIQGWMYHGNVASLFANKLLFRAAPVLWNIRHSLDDTNTEKKLTSLLIRMGARISHGPRKIIYNSRVSARQHENIGYSAEGTVVIPNGFDCEVFSPSEAAPSTLRNRLEISQDILLVALVARYHPIKDHKNFVAAAGLLAHDHPDMHFVLVGNGMERENIELLSLIESAGISDKVHLMGECDNVVNIIAGIDVMVLSSSGEAFPNVIGEAMACGVPCVSTNVGDAAAIIGDTGVVVTPRDPSELAAGVQRIVTMSFSERSQLGRKARRRIMKNYDLPVVVAQYEALYSSLVINHKH